MLAAEPTSLRDDIAVAAITSPFATQRVFKRVPVGGSISDILAMFDMPKSCPARVFVNDRMIRDSERAEVFPKPGDVVTLRAIPMGGGGQGSKDPGRMLLQLAMVAAAVGVTALTAGAAAPLMGPALGMALGAAAGTATSMVGNLAINALIPPPSPSSPKASTSPARFTISGRHNVAAPYSVIGKVLGSRQIAPVLAAAPYTEIKGEEEYLRMLFLVGYGPVDVTQITIGNSPIDTFQSVEWEIRHGFGDDTPARLYPGSVVEQDFNILLAQDPNNIVHLTGWNTQTSGTGADELAVDITCPGGLYTIGKTNGKHVSAQLTAMIRWRPHTTSNTASNATLSPAADGVTKTFTGTLTTPNEGSITVTSGTVTGTDDGTLGVISGTGIAAGSKVNYKTGAITVKYTTAPAVGQTPSVTYQNGNWTYENDVVMQSAKADIVRRAHTWRVPNGQYDVAVQVRPGSVLPYKGDWSNSVIMDTYWTALRTIRAQSPFTMSGLCVLGLRIRASHQLNGEINNLRCVVSSVLPDYDAASGSWYNYAGLWRYNYDNAGNGGTYSLDTVNVAPSSQCQTGDIWITDETAHDASGNHFTLTAGTYSYSGKLLHTPVEEGSLVISFGTQASTTSAAGTKKKAGISGILAFVSDDGKGNITGPGVVSGTINYATGAWTLNLVSTGVTIVTGMELGFDYVIKQFAGAPSTAGDPQPRALAIHTVAGTDGASVASKCIPVRRFPVDGTSGSPPNLQFVVSGQYKASSAIAQGITLRVYAGNSEDFNVGDAGVTHYDVVTNVAATTSYQTASATITIPSIVDPWDNVTVAKYNWIRVVAYHAPDAVGGVTVYWDNLSVVPLHLSGMGSVNQLPNPSFDFPGRTTSNPASHFRDVLQGPALKVSPKIADSRIDLTALQNWWTVCNTNSRFNNMIVDQQASVYKHLQTICAMGRATPFNKDGLYSVLMDQAQSTPVQIFTPRNSWGFKSTKAFPTLPHAVRVSYVDPNLEWKNNEIAVYASGYDKSTAVLYERLDLTHGCIDVTQAWKEGAYHIAQAYNRPEVYELESDIESLVATRGDLIYVQHDVPQWGLGSGRIKTVSVDGSGNCTGVVVDEQLTLQPATTYNIRVWRSNGTTILANLATVGTVTTTSTLTFATAIPAANPQPEVGDMFAFGLVNSETVPLLLTRWMPNVGMGPDVTVKMSLVDYVGSAIYNADANPPTYINSVTNPPDNPASTSVNTVGSSDAYLPKSNDGSAEQHIAISLNPVANTKSKLGHIIGVQAKYKHNSLDQANNTGAYNAATSYNAGDVATYNTYNWISLISANVGTTPGTDGTIWALLGDYSGPWIETPVQPTNGTQPAQILIPKVEPGRIYDILTRYEYERGFGPWTKTTHTVVGQTTAPPDITGLTATPTAAQGYALTWAAPTIPHFREVEIRDGASWAAGTVVAKVRTNRFEANQVSVGAHTLWVGVLDTSGNYSTTPPSVSVTVSSPPSNAGASHIFNLFPNAVVDATGAYVDILNANTWAAAPFNCVLSEELFSGNIKFTSTFKCPSGQQTNWFFFDASNNCYVVKIGGDGIGNPVSLWRGTSAGAWTNVANSTLTAQQRYDNQKVTATIQIHANGKFVVAINGVRVLTASDTTYTINGPIGYGVQDTHGLLPSFVQGRIVNVGAIQNGTLAFTSNVTKGDTLIVGARVDPITNTVTSITDTLGTVYTRVAGPIDEPSGHSQFYVYKGVATASGANTVTVNCSAANTNLTIYLAEYLNTAGVLDGTPATAVGSSTAVDSGAFTTSVTNSILLGLVAIWGLPTSTPGTGWTNRVDGGAGQVIEDRSGATPGSYDATETLNTAVAWAAVGFALQPTSGATVGGSIYNAHVTEHEAVPYTAKDGNGVPNKPLLHLFPTATMDADGKRIDLPMNGTNTLSSYLQTAQTDYQGNIQIKATTEGKVEWFLPTGSAAGTNSGYLFDIDSAGGAAAIYKYVSGTATVLTSGSFTGTSGAKSYQIRYHSANGKIELKVGSLLLKATDTSQTINGPIGVNGYPLSGAQSYLSHCTITPHSGVHPDMRDENDYPLVDHNAAGHVGSQHHYRHAVMSLKPNGYWRLGEQIGTTAHDISGHNNKGTYTGAVANGTSLITGDPDGALAITATSGVVTVPNSGTLALSTFTFGFWVNGAAAGQNYASLAWMDGFALNSGGWNIQEVANNATIQVRIDNATALNQAFVPVGNIYDGGLHFVVIACNGASLLQISIDGGEYQNFTISGTFAVPSVALNIGGSVCTIDEAFMLNYVLDMNNVQALYTLGKVGAPRTQDHLVEGADFVRNSWLKPHDSQIQNGNFESSANMYLQGGSRIALPPGWVTFSGPGMSASYETAAPYEGRQSLKLTVAFPGDGIGPGNTAHVEPGDVIKFGGAMFGDGTHAARIILRFYDGNWNILTTDSVANTAASWSYQTKLSTAAPSNAVYGGLELSCDAAGSTCKFDKIIYRHVKNSDDEVKDSYTTHRAVSRKSHHVVQNPDFQASTDIPPIGWMNGPDAVGSLSLSSYSWETSTPYTGVRSLRIQTSQQFGGLQSRPIHVVPGERWNWKVAARLTPGGVGGSSTVGLWFGDKNGTFVTAVGSSVANTTWTVYSGGVTVPANAETMWVFCDNQNGLALDVEIGYGFAQRVRNIADEVQDSTDPTTGNAYYRKLVGSATRTNHMVHNAGFDDFPDNATIAEGWEQGSTSGAPTFFRSTNTFAGAYCQGITNSASAGGSVISAPIGVRPGHKYTFGVRVQSNVANPGAFYFRIAWFNNDGGSGEMREGGTAQISTVDIVGAGGPTAANTWQQFSGTVQAPAGAVIARVILYNWVGTANSMLFDTVRCSPYLLGNTAFDTADPIQTGSIQDGAASGSAEDRETGAVTLTRNSFIVVAKVTFAASTAGHHARFDAFANLNISGFNLASSTTDVIYGRIVLDEPAAVGAASTGGTVVAGPMPIKMPTSQTTGTCSPQIGASLKPPKYTIGDTNSHTYSLEIELSSGGTTLSGNTVAGSTALPSASIEVHELKR